LRLHGFDYSSRGYYFITIVTHGRVCRFGDVHDGEMNLNAAGRMVEEAFQQMLIAFPCLEDVIHIIMPNHVHFLISNMGDESVPEAVRWFKSKSTNGYIHGVKEQGWLRFDLRLWQTRFYDVIIRNTVAHDYVVNYIYNNPIRWQYDRLNADVDTSIADNIGNELHLINW
jgi:REP element-mobilizing transposase RayT